MNRFFPRPFKRTAWSIAVLGAGALLAGIADAQTKLVQFNAPGIPQTGFPDFVNLDDVNLVFGRVGPGHSHDDGKGGSGGIYVLLANATGAFNYYNYSSTAAAVISKATFSLFAEFNSKGQFLSGSEMITGCIPGRSCKTPTDLFSATFDKFGVSTSTPGLGFETVASTAGGWAKQFEKGDESVYLFSAASLNRLDRALASGKNLPNYFSATVSEITTVPLPATAWLFGPAFAALFGIMRRRNPAVTDAAPSA